MKFNMRKITICWASALFFVAAISCCCVTKTVQAKEPEPSCHQTTHDTEPSDTTKECGCDQTFATVEEAKFLKDSLVQVAAVSFNQLLSNPITIFEMVDAYHPPPLVADTLRLYIKYSIFRI